MRASNKDRATVRTGLQDLARRDQCSRKAIMRCDRGLHTREKRGGSLDFFGVSMCTHIHTCVVCVCDWEAKNDAACLKEQRVTSGTSRRWRCLETRGIGHNTAPHPSFPARTAARCILQRRCCSCGNNRAGGASRQIEVKYRNDQLHSGHGHFPTPINHDSHTTYDLIGSAQENRIGK